MSDEPSVLPEFSQLLLRASQVGIDKVPEGGFSIEQRRAVTSLLDFARDYDVAILAGMESPL